jgi:intracellular multiplication protein IcmC
VPVIDLGVMLTNLKATFGSLERLIGAFSYVAGVVFIARGMFLLKTAGDHPGQGQKGELIGPIVSLGVGAVLLYLPTSINMGLNTIFASTELGTASELFSYTSRGDVVNWQEMTNVLVSYMKLLGLIAFVRGWIMISKVGHGQGQPGNLSKGVIHIISGILLINIIDTLKILGTTFGFIGFSVG